VAQISKRPAVALPQSSRSIPEVRVSINAVANATVPPRLASHFGVSGVPQASPVHDLCPVHMAMKNGICHGSTTLSIHNYFAVLGLVKVKICKIQSK
jgi:hypothetical protein